MKEKKNLFIFMIGMITGAAVILSLGGLLLARKEAEAISIIGGADGPTAIYIAGKVNYTPVYVGAAILVLIAAGYIVYRKKRKGGS